MKLELLYIADLIALKDELHRRTITCYKDRYLTISKKKVDGPNEDELLQMAVKYSEQFEAVKKHLDERLSLIEY